VRFYRGLLFAAAPAALFWVAVIALVLHLT
jgi:hypothetical protein